MFIVTMMGFIDLGSVIWGVNNISVETIANVLHA